MQPREQHPVEGCSRHREVLDPYTVRDRDDAVGAQSSAVDNGLITILSPHGDIGGVDQQLLRVDPRSDDDRAARTDAVGGIGESCGILRYAYCLAVIGGRARRAGGGCQQGNRDAECGGHA